MLLVFAQRISNGTADPRNFKAVKIILIVEAIVTFVKFLSIALMTLKKLNTNLSNFLNWLVNSLKILQDVTLLRIIFAN